MENIYIFTKGVNDTRDAIREVIDMLRKNDIKYRAIYRGKVIKTDRCRVEIVDDKSEKFKHLKKVECFMLYSQGEYYINVISDNSKYIEDIEGLRRVLCDE